MKVGGAVLYKTLETKEPGGVSVLLARKVGSGAWSTQMTGTKLIRNRTRNLGKVKRIAEAEAAAILYGAVSEWSEPSPEDVLDL